MVPAAWCRPERSPAARRRLQAVIQVWGASMAAPCELVVGRISDAKLNLDDEMKISSLFIK